MVSYVTAGQAGLEGVKLHRHDALIAHISDFAHVHQLGRKKSRAVERSAAFVNGNGPGRHAGFIGRQHRRRISLRYYFPWGGQKIQRRRQDLRIAGGHFCGHLRARWNSDQAALHGKLRLTRFLRGGITGHLDGIEGALGGIYLANLVIGRVQGQYNGGVRRAEDAQSGWRFFGCVSTRLRRCRNGRCQGRCAAECGQKQRSNQSDHRDLFHGRMPPQEQCWRPPPQVLPRTCAATITQYLNLVNQVGRPAGHSRSGEVMKGTRSKRRALNKRGPNWSQRGFKPPRRRLRERLR